MTEEPTNDDLRARRTRVFREVREGQRRHNAAVKREYDTAREKRAARSLEHGKRFAVPSVFWATGIAASAKVAPWLSNKTAAPTLVVFTVLGFLLGFAFGITLDAESRHGRLKQALVIGVIHAALLGGIMYLWPLSAWQN